MTLTKLIKSISTKEWRVIIIVGLVLIIITLGIPLFGYLITPENFIWSGRQSLAPGDFSVYESYLWQVKDGKFIFTDLFTTESINQVYPWWLVVGWIGKILLLQPKFTLHLVKILPLFPLLITAYLLISYFWHRKKWRLAIFLTLCFASGFGALTAPLFQAYDIFNSQTQYWQWPIDLWVPEGNFFLSIYYSSHFSLGLAFFLFTLLSFFLALETQKTRYFLLAGLSNFLLFSFHPFHLPTLMGITLICFFFSWIKNFWRWRLTAIPKLLSYLIISIIPFAYYLQQLITNPLLQQKASQNNCPSPHFLFTFIGYGPWLILGLAGLLIVIFKTKSQKKIWLVLWTLIHGLCLYLPLNFQRRLNTGWQVALILLSFTFLSYLLLKIPKLRKIPYWSLLSIIILFFFFTTFVNLSRDFSNYLAKNTTVHYLPQSLEQLAEYIRANIPAANTVFLAPSPYDNLLPGFTGRRVYLGHGVETVFFLDKQKTAQTIFQAAQPLKEIYQFCLNQGITHLVLTPDQPLARLYLPPYFQKIYSQPDFCLYQLNPAANLD